MHIVKFQRYSDSESSFLRIPRTRFLRFARNERASFRHVCEKSIFFFPLSRRVRSPRILLVKTHGYFTAFSIKPGVKYLAISTCRPRSTRTMNFTEADDYFCRISPA